MKVNARGLDHRALNDLLRDKEGDIEISGCLGQRFICSGQKGKTVTIGGVPGNALGAYLDGADIIVNGNAQDAVGDTMNRGTIVIHGSAGDAVGYAMRGGVIYVRDSAGYRSGIHMKAYAEKLPVIVVGRSCGSFLGEYQAGGLILVLGIGVSDEDVIGDFCGTGMHGGKIFLRAREIRRALPAQVCVREAGEEDLAQIRTYVAGYERHFGIGLPEDGKKFFVLTPNTRNPYKQLYVPN